jgi:hypothetical protein
MMASRRCRAHGVPGNARDQNTHHDYLSVPRTGGFIPAQAIDRVITGTWVHVAGVVLVADVTVLQAIVFGFEDQALAQHRCIVPDSGRFFAVYRAAVA